jgi:hypothetical protein
MSVLANSKSAEMLTPAKAPRIHPVDTNPRTELLAHHEAAHAVVCFVLYGEQVIREVELFGDESGRHSGLTTFSLLPIPIVCRPSSGVPRRGNPAPVSPDAIADAHGVLSYAGIAGEALFQRLALDDPCPEKLLDSDQTERFGRDRQALARLADTVNLSRPSHTFYPEYWNEAHRLLRSHWSGVSSIAECLSVRGSLNGGRIDEVLCEAFPV